MVKDRNRYQDIPAAFVEWCEKVPLQQHGWFLSTPQERESTFQMMFLAYQHGIAEGQKELIAKNKKLLEDNEAFILLDEEDNLQVLPDVKDPTEEDIDEAVDLISGVPNEEPPASEEKKFSDWGDF